MNILAWYTIKARWNILILLGCGVAGFMPSDARADLKPQQARRLIARMAGLELPNSSVRVKTISNSSASSAEVAAEIKAVFKFEKDSTGRWRVTEVRVGPDRWLQINLVANALNTKIPIDECTAPDPPRKGASVVDPSAKRARCLLATLLGVQLPSDLVRIQQVAPFVITVASQPSVVVLALITINAKLANEGKNGWRVTELRAGSSDWVGVDSLAASIDSERKEQARGEMAWMVEALEKYRKERGFYVVSDSQAVVMDHLSPRYLPRVIRVDPWQRPYKYQGERARFVLRSVGADGAEGTGDDIEVTSPSR